MDDFKFIGLDSTLLDLIFFPNESEKSEYLRKVEEALTVLKIRIGDKRLDVINKIADADIDIEFLREIIAYSGGLQYSQNSPRNNYYTDCKLCGYNLEEKKRSGISDFRSEEALFERIMQIEFAGYAKANLILNMGTTFCQKNMWKKADDYFEILRNSNFDLSSATLSDFYRIVGETYFESGKASAALTWLQDGLKINPKLPVKKLIKKLEVN